MKASHKGLAGNTLFALNIFIVFLLVFESRIVVPQWLQPLGRMHPMFLHFPIAILMLAMLMEFFRFRTAYRTQEFYQSFTTNLLLAGLFTSAITVIMGLVLSHEEGYEGNALQWHKWSGLSTVFITSIIYWSRNSEWYKVPVAKTGAFLTFICLLLAGHYGAILTHGDNFILAPIASAEEPVPLERAMVFNDVISPILKQKCISCHNPDKIKGGLILTDSASLLQGGKTGPLFIAGNPEMSLLLERLHLPEDDKKHMPPRGKAQLTEEELALLYLWVKENAYFSKKVVDLAPTDSLRLLASNRLSIGSGNSEEFAFAAADDKTISELNNNYRVIAPLAKNSPALSVNVFNKASYSPKVLEELSPIKTQIISLNVDNMPVKDTELRTIAGFENLRELNLNFTDITGKGMQYLTGLKKLKSLSLAGTKMDYAALKQLQAFKSLQKVVVWETGLKDSEIESLQKANSNVQIISGFKDDGKPIKLNLPTLKNKTTVFADVLPLELEHPIKGVDLRYTLDNTEPDSLNSLKFKPGMSIKDDATVKVKAFKEGWISSNVAIFNFQKSRFKPDSIELLSPPDDRFRGDGARSLVNGLSDNYTLKTSDEWIGFTNTDLNALMRFKKPKTVSSVSLNTMIDVNGEVHPPASVQIWGGSDKSHLRLLKSVIPQKLTVRDTSRKGQKLNTIVCKFSPTSVNYLKVIAVRQTHTLKETIAAEKKAAAARKQKEAQAQNAGKPKKGKKGKGKKKKAEAAKPKGVAKDQVKVPPPKPKKPQPASLFVNEILVN